MASVLLPHESKWYEELRSVSFYSEANLEREILHHAKHLFPGFLCIPFKVAVTADGSKKSKPDLALIDMSLRSWQVVEVELDGHSAEHVIDQIDTFINGSYNAPSIARYIKEKIFSLYGKDVPLKKLSTMIQTIQPKIIVIADHDKISWRDQLKTNNVELWTFEIYKSPGGQHIYRTNGNFPRQSVQEVCCKWFKSLSNTLELAGAFSFKPEHVNKPIDILFNGKISNWAPVHDKGKWYLVFRGHMNPLSPLSDYSLHRDKDFNYSFSIC